MTKKEEAAFKALEKELAIAKAFRWYDPVEPDVPRPDNSLKRSKGWTAHFRLDSYVSRAEVNKASSGTGSHYQGASAWDEKPPMGSQGSIALYSNPINAIRNEQAKACRRFAEAMAELNQQIEALSTAHPAPPDGGAR